MDKCPLCKSTDIERARNDCGHFKGEKSKPIRMYQYRCLGCGFVGTMATKEKES